MPNVRDRFRLFSMYQPSGVARTIDFRVPYGCVIEALEASADAADGTDNPVVALRTGTTVLFSVNPTAGNTVVRDTTVAVGRADRYNEGDGLNIDLSFNGTAANVLGLYVVVWAQRKPR